EQLQEQQADRISLREDLIAAGVWKLGDETFGAQLGEIVAQRAERIAFGGTSERLDDMRIEFCGGKAVAGGDVREAHEGVHQGKLAGLSSRSPGMGFSVGVMGGSASRRKWPRSMKVSRISCWTLR